MPIATIAGVRVEVEELVDQTGVTLRVFVSDAVNQQQFSAIVRGLHALGWTDGGLDPTETRSRSSGGAHVVYTVKPYRFRHTDPSATVVAGSVE